MNESTKNKNITILLIVSGIRIKLKRLSLQRIIAQK